MKSIKVRESFLAFMHGKKEFTLPERDNSEDQYQQLLQLAQYVSQYRHYQKLYFAKLQKNEFAKDEQHFMMKYQEKIDNLLKQIQL